MMQTYDQWKCTDPREFEPEPEACAHEDYEVDTIEGRCECSHCGDRWYASPAAVQAAIDSEIAYAEYIRQMESPWYRLREWGLVRWYRFKRLLRIRRRRPPPTDDDIPF